MKRASLVSLLGLACLLGCSAERDIDDRIYGCAVDSDCGEGFGCFLGAPYADDFCAPVCDASCDGTCVRQGERELCLRGCRIFDDGSTSMCASRGLECIRISTESDEGVCYPAKKCDDLDDCGDNEVCLSILAGLGATDGNRNNFYCVPAPVGPEQECPVRSLALPITEDVSMCLATCVPPDTRCPPGFGCVDQAAFGGRDGDTFCLPGLYGVPCNDDTSCLRGRCIDTGPAGKMCTLSCNDAVRAAGTCNALPNIGFVWDALSFECDETAPGDGGLCVTRSNIGFICTEPDSTIYTCSEGLFCEAPAFAPEGVRVCTKVCAGDSECTTNNIDYAYCERSIDRCVPRAPDGAFCETPNQCASRRCEAGVCAPS